MRSWFAGVPSIAPERSNHVGRVSGFFEPVQYVTISPVEDAENAKASGLP
jgi:hypothetical protein